MPIKREASLRLVGLIAVTAALVCVACSQRDTSAEIVGTWSGNMPAGIVNSPPLPVTWAFTADGQFHEVVVISGRNGSSIIETMGRYRRAGDKMTYSHPSGVTHLTDRYGRKTDHPGGPPFIMSDTMKLDSPDQLTWTDWVGTVTVLQRSH